VSFSLGDLFQVVIPSFSGGVVVVFLAKNWFLERLRGSIKNEYDHQLENLKADLAAKNSMELEALKASLTRDASIVSAVQKSFGDSHNSSQPHRVNSIKDLWESLLHVQLNTPAVFTLLDVLLPSEYGEALGAKQLKTFSDISNDDIERMLSGKAATAQSHRLLAGDYLWSLFRAYQALNMRIAFLFQTGRSNANVSAWYEDGGCISIVRSVCSAEEFDEFNSQEFGKILWIRGLIESKFLLAANRILSGQASSDSALEEARRISYAVSSAG